MNTALYCVVCFPAFLLATVHAVAPAACFANFRFDDCGKPAVPVMYYWKPGSRCEVGMWRGCLPNINMFQDEYECVSTCIFTVRAAPKDYHEINGAPDYAVDVIPETTVADYDLAGNQTVSDGSQDSSTPSSGDATATGTADGGGANVTGASGNASETAASGTTLSSTTAAVVTTTTAAPSNK